MFTILYQTYDDNLEHYFINCSHAQIACVEKKPWCVDTEEFD